MWFNSTTAQLIQDSSALFNTSRTKRRARSPTVTLLIPCIEMTCCLPTNELSEGIAFPKERAPLSCSIKLIVKADPEFKARVQVGPYVA